MYKKILIFMCLLLAFAMTPVSASLLTINDLIENKRFDQQTLTITGEAIGDKMIRGDHAWININDGTNAIGLYMSKALSKKITMLGDYKKTGDTVEITGVFHRNCKAHGGDVDIHVISLKVIKKGQARREKISFLKIGITLLLVILTCILSIFYLFQYKRR